MSRKHDYLSQVIAYIKRKSLYQDNYGNRWNIFIFLCVSQLRNPLKTVSDSSEMCFWSFFIHCNHPQPTVFFGEAQFSFSDHTIRYWFWKKANQFIIFSWWIRTLHVCLCVCLRGHLPYPHKYITWKPTGIPSLGYLSIYFLQTWF